MRKTLVTLAIAAALIVSFAVTQSSAAATSPQTLDNLQTAFNGESNAHARYLAFATRADQDGYAGVASLFRAAARAEEVHAANHAVVIKELHGTPKATIETPSVKSTAENIEAAIKGESYERDTMYPQFIKKARAEKQTAAIRTFNFAKTAEAEHARLYSDALKGKEGMKAAKNFYVCSVCGYTTTDLNFAKCLSCFNPKDKYVAVS